MDYKEDVKQGNSFRKEYFDGLNSFVDTLRQNSDKKRGKFIEDVFKDQDCYREKFINMLGYPLNEFETDDIPRVKKQVISDNGHCKIYRVQIEIMDNLWFYGILFTKDESRKLPLVISQHGGGGTPEICSSFFDSANYNDMTQRILKYDVNVFAPQLLLWDENTYGMSHNRLELDKRLKQVGSSITAVEVYGIMKSINYLSTLDYVDEDRIGMVGLSYGGFYTLFVSAIDTRIKSAYSSCFFNRSLEYPWGDWVWFNSANTFGNSEIALLVYPRYILFTVADNDECFDFSTAMGEYERFKDLCRGQEDWFDFRVFNGVHEFSKNDEFIKMMIEKL